MKNYWSKSSTHIDRGKTRTYRWAMHRRNGRMVGYIFVESPPKGWIHGEMVRGESIVNNFYPWAPCINSVCLGKAYGAKLGIWVEVAGRAQSSIDTDNTSDQRRERDTAHFHQAFIDLGNPLACFIRDHPPIATFRKGDKFAVRAEVADGRVKELEVTHAYI